MLVIRKEQIQRFIYSDDGELAEVIAHSIRKANGDRVSDYEDKDLQRMIKIGIERARANSLTGAEDIAAFIAVMFEVAPRFDEQQDIRAVLNDELFTPEIRFYQLFDRVSDDAWKEAEKKYEDSFWLPDGTTVAA